MPRLSRSDLRAVPPSASTIAAASDAPPIPFVLSDQKNAVFVSVPSFLTAIIASPADEAAATSLAAAFIAGSAATLSVRRPPWPRSRLPECVVGGGESGDGGENGDAAWDGSRTCPEIGQRESVVDGAGTYTYAYSTSSVTNPNPSGDPGAYNVWTNKLVETLPDGTTNTLYTNKYGQTILSVSAATATGAAMGRFLQVRHKRRGGRKGNPSRPSLGHRQYLGIGRRPSHAEQFRRSDRHHRLLFEHQFHDRRNHRGRRGGLRPGHENRAWFERHGNPAKHDDATTGAPLGTEAISSVQSLSRSLMNAAGQVIETDNYYDLTTNRSTSAAWTYSTTAQIGKAWNHASPSTAANYYATTSQYSHRGQLEKTVNPNARGNEAVFRDDFTAKVIKWETIKRGW